MVDSRRLLILSLTILDLFITSAFGVFLVNAFQNAAYAALLAGDCDDCGFNDLGKLLFGGLVLALLVGVAASLLWRRQKENDSKSDFVSIRSEFQKPDR